MSNRVLQIAPEDVSAFAKEADMALDNATSGTDVSLAKFGAGLMAVGQAMAEKRMTRIELPPCNLVFRAGGIEYDEWAAALLLMARSAELLRRKARDGQCNGHMQPCAVAAEMETEIYRACLDSFQALLDEMKQKKIEDPD